MDRPARPRSCCTVSVPTSTVRRSSGQALLGSAVGSPGLATVTTMVQRCGAPATRSSDLLLEEVGATLREFLGRDRNRLRRWQQRPSHHMLRAGAVDEDEAVEAVEPIFRVAAGPGRALRPIAEGRELRMRGGECLHRVRVLARRGEQQLVEGLRCRRPERHGGSIMARAPFLSVRRRDPHSHAPHADRRIRRVRIGGAEVEAPEHRILAAGENLSLRELRSGPVRFEHAGEADALGVVAAVTERRASRRRKRSHHLVRRETLRREPSRRVGKGSGAGANDDGDQHQRSKRGRSLGRWHSDLAVMVRGSRSHRKFFAPLSLRRGDHSQ